MVAQRNTHHRAVMSHCIYSVKWIQSTRWNSGSQTLRVRRSESEQGKSTQWSDKQGQSYENRKGEFEAKEGEMGSTPMTQLLCYIHLKITCCILVVLK